MCIRDRYWAGPKEVWRKPTPGCPEVGHRPCPAEDCRQRFSGPFCRHSGWLDPRNAGPGPREETCCAPPKAAGKFLTILIGSVPSFGGDSPGWPPDGPLRRSGPFLMWLFCLLRPSTRLRSRFKLLKEFWQKRHHGITHYCVQVALSNRGSDLSLCSGGRAPALRPRILSSRSRMLLLKR